MTSHDVPLADPQSETAQGWTPTLAGPEAKGLLDRTTAANMERGVDHAARTHSRVAGKNAVETRPCFFHRDCRGTAEVEKQGKAVCRKCAAGLKGDEYPLRGASREPLYANVRELILQLEMKESGHGGSET